MASEFESLRCIKGVLDKETASNAPAVAEIIAIPVKQKNSQVNRLLPALCEGFLRVGPLLLLLGRPEPDFSMLRLTALFPLGGCLDEIDPFLTVLTQFPHQTMIQATNFTDQITEANLKLLNTNSIFQIAYTIILFLPVSDGMGCLAIGFGVWLSVIAVGLFNELISGNRSGD